MTGNSTPLLEAKITQLDACEEFIRRHQHQMRYQVADGTWLTYTAQDGWRPDYGATGTHERIVETLREIKDWRPADSSPVHAKRQAGIRRTSVQKLETIGNINGIRNMAERDRSLHVGADEVDVFSSLLGAPNGIINLKTGEICPFQPNFLVTQRVKPTYEPQATCPRWIQFLKEVFGQDSDVLDYIQKLVGYTLTGETTLQQMWMLVGDGSNGKSTFLRVLMEMLGSEYAQQTPESVLLGKASTQASNDLVRLKKVRMAVLHETNHGQRLNESRVKALVSGDRTTARGLYKEFEEFDPQAKYFLATNHLPTVVSTDNGIWRRIVVVPFNNRFEVNSDKALLKTLRTELPGILAWAVRGSRDWYTQGMELPVPELFRERTDTYRSECDSITQFLDEMTTAVPDHRVTLQDAYEAYQRWCMTQGRAPVTKNDLGTRIAETQRAAKAKYGQFHKVHLTGIRLNDAQNDSETSRGNQVPLRLQ